MTARAMVLSVAFLMASSAGPGVLKSQAVSTPPQTQQPQTAASTAAIVFGVGSPNISAERSGTSIGIVAGGTLYLFDAGAGVERRIMEATPKLDALNVHQFGPVFITHTDMDHTIGLVALFNYHNFEPRVEVSRTGERRRTGLRLGGGQLTIYGPKAVPGAIGIVEKVTRIEAAFSPNQTYAPNIRVEELNVGQRSIKPIEIQPGVIYQDKAVTVSAFTVAHKTPVSFGFRVQTADRLIVISGDTSPVDAVVDVCNGCDLLFHEVFGLAFGPKGPTGDAQGHTSAEELGQIARRARPKHLVIYHDVNVPEKDGRDAIAKSFNGKVTFANDLDVF